MSQPRLKKYRFAIGAALSDSCEVPEGMLKETLKRHEAYTHDRHVSLIKETGISPKRANIEETKQVARLAYVAQFLKLESDDAFDHWSLSRPNTKLQRPPGWYWAFQSAQEQGLFFFRILDELKKTYADLNEVNVDCEALNNQKLRELRD